MINSGFKELFNDTQVDQIQFKTIKLKPFEPKYLEP